METPVQQTPALRLDPVEVFGVPSELLGRAESARGVQLVAYQYKLNSQIEYTVATDSPTFCYILKAPVDTSLTREGRPCEGRLNYFVPGAPLALRGTGLMIGVICIFGPSFLAGLSEIEVGHPLTKIGLMTDIESERLIYLGRAMFREAVEPGFASSLFAEAMGMVSASEIARYERAHQADEGHSRGGLAPWQKRRLESHIRANLSEALNLKSLGRLVGISARHLSRAVRRTKGVSVYRWISDFRLAEARRMLTETDLPIHEIARRSAFQSSGAFSTAFRAASGYTPGEFRKLPIDGK
jgi:AraC family transcriptional regulator